VPWSVGRILQCPAKEFDSPIDAVIELDYGPVRPELAVQFLPRHQLARVFEEQHQDLHGLIRNPNPYSVAAQFSSPHIQLEGTKAEGARRLSGAHFGQLLGA
jgi:hypothetical protein